MLVGMLAMIVMVSIFIYTSVGGTAVYNFKKKYPVVGIVLILLGGCFVTYTLGSLLVFLIGILMPFCGKNYLLLKKIISKIALLLFFFANENYKLK